jgi:hypothetical protein
MIQLNIPPGGKCQHFVINLTYSGFLLSHNSTSFKNK